MTVAREARASRDSRIEVLVRRTIRPLLWLVVLVPAVWGVYALFTDNLGAEPVEALEHYTGEWTLRILAGCLAVTPLIRLTGWGWLVPQRRFLGLAAFFWAFGHFLTYVGIDKFFNLLAEWGSYVSPLATQVLPVSTDTFMGIVGVIAPDEAPLLALVSLIAHELAHIKHRHMLVGAIAATMAGVIMMVSRFAMFFGGSRDEDSNPLAMIAKILSFTRPRAADSAAPALRGTRTT